MAGEGLTELDWDDKIRSHRINSVDTGWVSWREPSGYPVKDST